MKSVGKRSVYSYQNYQLTTLDTEGNYQTVKAADGILSLANIKQQPALYENSQSMVWDIGI